MAGTVFSADRSTGVILTNGGLTAESNTASGSFAVSADTRSSGKYAIEFSIVASGGSPGLVGLVSTAVTTFAASSSGNGAWPAAVNMGSGQVFFNSTGAGGTIGAPVTGDKISIEVDLDKKTASVRRNGGTPVTGTFTANYVAPAFQAFSTGVKVALNSGDTAFTYAPSEGYTLGWPAPGEPTALLVTQIGMEVFAAPTSDLLVSHIALEVWAATAVLAQQARRRRSPVVIQSNAATTTPTPLTWSSLVDPGADGTESGWTNYTIRSRLLSSITAGKTGTKARITVKASSSGLVVTGLYIGKASTTGAAYNFASTPKQVLFGGSGSVTLAANAELTSDPVDLVLDGSEIVVAIQVGTSILVRSAAAIPGWDTYYRSGGGGDPSEIVASTAYTSYAIDGYAITNIEFA